VLLDGWDILVAMRYLKISIDRQKQAKTAIALVKAALAKESVELLPYPLFPVKSYFEENTIIDTNATTLHSGIKKASAADACYRSQARYAA
jgi:hypothetical protein